MDSQTTHRAVSFRLISPHLLFAAICLLFLGVGNADAQRTSDRQFYLGADGGTVVAGDRGFSCGMSFGQYLLGSKWDAGIGWMPRRRSQGDFYHQIVAGGGWSYRFFGTRNRAVNLYGGVGALVGYEHIPYTFTDLEEDVMYEEGGSVSNTIVSSSGQKDKVALLYGLYASLELEMFVSRRVAFMLSSRMPLIFDSAEGIFGLSMNVGMRFNL